MIANRDKRNYEFNTENTYIRTKEDNVQGPLRSERAGRDNRRSNVVLGKSEILGQRAIPSLRQRYIHPPFVPTHHLVLTAPSSLTDRPLLLLSNARKAHVENAVRGRFGTPHLHYMRL